MPQLIDLGRIRLQFLGDYSASTSYKVNDVVRYGGNLYVYKNATNAAAIIPTTTTHWALMLEGFNFRGAWGSSANYLVGDVANYGGLLYIALANSTNIQPDDDATKWEKFLEGFKFEGVYNSATSYQEGDVVRLGGSLFIAKADSLNEIPGVAENDDKWDLFAPGLNSRGEYSEANVYLLNDLVTVGGRSYRATKTAAAGDAPYDTYTNPTTPWALQTSGLRFRGNWAATAVYEIDDIVVRGANVFVATAHHTSSAAFVTDSATKWTSLTSGVRWTNTWQIGTSYFTGDLMTDGVSVYVANLDHTSVGTVGSEITAAKWAVFAGGADYLPAQSGQTNKLLSTDGTDPVWVEDINIDGIIEIGAGANEFNTAADLTDPIAVFNIDGEADSYAQLSIHNAEATSSTDLIVYSDNGDDTSGWIDMGVTGSKFEQSEFGLTRQNEGYIFYEAPEAGPAKTVSNRQLTANVVTLTTTTAHGFVVGQSITVAGVQAELNGTFTVASVPTTTTFTYAKTSGNLASAPAGGTVKQQSTGNLIIATGDQGSQNKIIIGAGGFADGQTQIEITPGVNVHVEIDTPSTSPTTGAVTVVGGVGISGDVNILGDLSVDGDISLVGLEFLAVGNGAATFAGTLTNPVAVFQKDADDFAQIAFRNIGNQGDSSTDFLAYADVGTDAAGWIDMGITSSTFNDPEFTITGNHDGYIFMEAPVGTTGDGNLVIATGGNGLQNKIIFAAGGLDASSEQMSITPDQNVHIEIATPSTSATTGALTVVGGTGILGNLNVQGNVGVVGNMNIQGEITVAGAGTTFATNNLAVSDPMIFVASPNSADVLDFAFVGESAVAITPIVATITSRTVASNVATVTTSAAHTFQAGDFVTIAGAVASINGQQLITAVTSTTFTFDVTTTNVSATATNGTATVSARAKYSGLAKDASESKWKLFKGLSTKPTTQVNFTESGTTLDSLGVDNLDASGTIAATTDVTVNGLSVIDKGDYPAKGAIVAATGANTTAALSVGSNNTFVQADSTQATGLKYTSLATDTVLGAVQVVTSSTKPATPSNGQLVYETDTFNLNRYTANGWRTLGPTFLGFSVDNNGNLTATTGSDVGQYNVSSYLDYTILPSEMTVSVNNGNLLLTA